jgi:hypothetical protein
VEADLEEVETIRRSLRKQSQPQPAPLSERAKKGWLAHQSIFPPSSVSSSDDSESEKETEDESGDERSRMMGRSRRKERSRSKSRDAADVEGYMLSPSELYHASTNPPVDEQTDLEEPLLGPDELERTRGGKATRVPVRLQVYHGRFGHWEREGLRKYKGETARARCSCSVVDQFSWRTYRSLLCMGFDRGECRLGQPEHPLTLVATGRRA